jgi:hypothetical protein
VAVSNPVAARRRAGLGEDGPERSNPAIVADRQTAALAG